MRLLLVTAIASAALAAPAAHARLVDVTVTVENLSPANSVSFAPLRFGFHNGTFDAFNNGTAATAPIISVAEGGSAGGLLMGAVANLAPRKYAGILAVVPFVDPVTSISDPQLPLSALEWEEWGNPIEDERVYRYMRGYAPYENVTATRYPAVLATTGLAHCVWTCPETVGAIVTVAVSIGLTVIAAVALGLSVPRRMSVTRQGSCATSRPNRVADVPVRFR